MTDPDLKFDVNTELAARRTGMAFQRTRLAEDRTLMTVIRTSLSYRLWLHDFPVLSSSARKRRHLKGRRAAPLRYCIGGSGRPDAVFGHRLSRPIHARTSPLTAVDVCGRAHPW